MTENRLLIADDEPAVAQLISRVGESLGYKVYSVATADSFLEHQRTQAPTHIVMDVHLPDLGALDLLERLGAEKCSAKLFLLSEVDRELIATARRVAKERGLNVIGAITKPMLVAELRTALLAAKDEIPWLSAATLSTALETAQLRLVYQPLVNIKSGIVVGFEALTRWQHPEYGEVPPADFILVAEKSIFIDRLTNWVLETGCQQLQEWDAAGTKYDLSLNISSRNLHNDRLPEILAGHCQAHGIAPTRITLEMTETTALRDGLLVLNTMKRLRDKGFNLSMDDFGTGYSSLAELNRLPFSEIKIDRTFVRDCTSASNSYAIVRLAIDLAHAMKLKVVAEGVETAETYSLLHNMGCDAAQGFLIALPTPAAELPELLAHMPALPHVRSAMLPSRTPLVRELAYGQRVPH